MGTNNIFFGFVSHDNFNKIVKQSDILRDFYFENRVGKFYFESEQIYQGDDIKFFILSVVVRLKAYFIFYKGVNCNINFILVKVISIFLRMIIKYIFDVIKNRNKKYVIEKLVTKKHIFLWEEFLNSNCDIGCICEDDVVYSGNLNTLKKVFQNLKFNENIYIDLAGGCELQNKTKYYKSNLPYLFLIYPPQSRTACSYLLTKPLVNLLLSEVKNDPSLMALPIDWLLNTLFTKNNIAVNIKCYVTEPTIFQHGSVLGTYKSWQSNE